MGKLLRGLVRVVLVTTVAQISGYETRASEAQTTITVPQLSSGLSTLVAPALQSQFDFAVDWVGVDGNILGTGNPNGGFDFLDEFDDGSLTTFPTSEFLCNQGLFPVNESGGFLNLRSSDGANNLSPGFLVDNCGLGLRPASPYRLTDGQGGARIEATFRADAPLPEQSYGLQVFTYQANDVVNIQVGGGCGTLSCVTALSTFPSVVTQTVPVDLTGVGRITLRLAIDDATNGVTHSFSVDGGRTFREIALPTPARTFTSGSTQAVVGVFGSVIVSSHPPVADFKQNRNADGSLVPWARDHLFDLAACPSMEAAGCAITSLADVLASYGPSLPDGTSTDPGHLNHYLGQKRGTHSGCLIYFEPAARAVSYNPLHNDFPQTTSLATRLQHIDSALAAGNLVIAGVRQRTEGQHFVVLYEKAPVPAPDGSPDYRIVDPFRVRPYATGDRSGMLLSQTYGTVAQHANDLRVVVIENKAPQPGRSWVIVAHSPVQLLITDPTGAQTGFDPTTGGYLLDVVGSAYGIEEGLADDTQASSPLPDATYFGQNDVLAGTYTIQVIGTGSGTYALDFAFASDPDDTTLQTIIGTAVPGSTDTYLVSVSAMSGEPATIQRKVPIDVKPGDFPNHFNPNGNGVVPVAILSTSTFDARSVDFRSVEFGPGHALGVDKQPNVEDVDGDGLLDLVLHFRTDEADIPAGATEVCLNGRSSDGVNISGCDSVFTVPPR